MLRLKKYREYRIAATEDLEKLWNGWKYLTEVLTP